MEASTVDDRNASEILDTDPTVHDKFLAAVDIVTSLPVEGPVTITTDEKLAFYSLYKQATIGPCNTPKPSFWNVVEKFKWDAWNSLGTMSSNEAKAIYVQRLLRKIKDVNKEYDTGVSDWMNDDLYERLMPKFAIIKVYPCDKHFKPRNQSGEEKVVETIKRPEAISEEQLLSDGTFEHTTSDVDYMDALDERCASRTSSANFSHDSEPEVRDRSDSMLRRYTSRIEDELKVISKQISQLSAAAENRHSTLTDMFTRATLSLLVPKRISWKTIVILIVWPFVANMLFRLFRSLIGI